MRVPFIIEWCNGAHLASKEVAAEVLLSSPASAESFQIIRNTSESGIIHL